jgi:signal recognition particle GTPase
VNGNITLDNYRLLLVLLAKQKGCDSVGLARDIGIIDAMTPEQRSAPGRIEASARVRIAAASGSEPDEVEQLLVQFGQMRDVMKEIAGMSFWQRLKFAMGFGRRPGPEGTGDAKKT